MLLLQTQNAIVLSIKKITKSEKNQQYKNKNSNFVLPSLNARNP